MIYGTPSPRIETDITDRIGIRTLIFSQLWQPSRWPMSDAELQQEKPGLPPVAGGMLFVGDETRPAGGGLRTYWTFEGIHGDGKSVTFKDRSNSLDYQFQAGLEQADIRQHPQIQQLLKKWGGTVDANSLEILWPQTVPDDSTGAGLRKTSGGREPARNPMYGRNEYLALTGTYTFRYADFDPPSKTGVNQIYKSGLPGRPPSYEDLDWLKAPPVFVRRGVVFDITEQYLLSPAGGWPEPIYELAADGNDNSLSGDNINPASAARVGDYRISQDLVNP